MSDLPKTMRGAILPGNDTAVLQEYPLPVPGPGQVLIRTGAGGVCGSDIKFIYHKHLTSEIFPDTVYKGVICGHEPCGQIVQVGPEVKKFKVGDRILVYHIQGCGVCSNCRAGYFIQCSDHTKHRAYGWQRDGAMADFVLVDESTAVALPEPLTYIDGALISCGFGTAYEGLRRAQVNGGDDLLVVGLGPVGMAAGIIGKLILGARRLIGVEPTASRVEFVKSLGVFDDIVTGTDDPVAEVKKLTNGRGADVTVDASGSAPGRSIALDSVAEWGRVSFLGEGGDVHSEVSDTMLHKQITIHASWVTSVSAMENLTRLLADKAVHPEMVVSHRLPLSKVDEGYALAAAGVAGKVVILPQEG
jgi:threonine dehydrogenase-like Zn-dependent dehydrogenase